MKSPSGAQPGDSVLLDTAKQDELLEALGFSVLRFSEPKVLEDPIGCARMVFDALEEPPPK